MSRTRPSILSAAMPNWIQFVQVACDHLDVAQIEGGHDYLRPPGRGRVEIDADDPPGGADHFRHDRQPAYGAAAAVDRVPPSLGTDPAERRAGHLRAEFSDPQ